GHAELADHVARKLGGLLDVVAGAGSDVVEGELFSDSSAHHDGQAGLEVIFRVRVPVALGQVRHHSQRHAVRHDGDLMQRVAVGQWPDHAGVEPAGRKQRRVEDVRTVGGGDEVDAFV